MDKMSYGEAKKIRGQSFGSRMTDKLLGDQGIGESFKQTLSEKTKATTTGIKEKFDPMNIAKFMTGGSRLAPAIVGKLTGRSQEDMQHFAGNKKGADTASKVGPLEQSNSMDEILLKILELMKSTNDNNTKHREHINAFAEEEKMEKDRRHKELLDAIKGKKTKTQTADKVEEDTGMGLGDVISNILNAFGGAKTALSLLTMLGGFVASPLGVALIGAVVAGTVGAWMIKQIAADPQAALEGKDGIGMAVAGLGSEGQLPSAEQEKTDKSETAKSQAVDKKGITGSTLEELEAKRKQLIEYGDPRARVKGGKGDKLDIQRAKQLDEIETEISKRKSTPESSAIGLSPGEEEVKTPTTSGAATATPVPFAGGSTGTETKSAESTSSAPKTSAIPTSSPNVSEKLNSTISENQNMKLEDNTPATSIITNSVNKITNSGSSSSGFVMPLVRNQEPTFKRMILNSTRVV